MDQARYPRLQLDEDLPLQKREWRLQRIAWVFLYTLLAAIILGLLGNGPLSHSFTGTEDGSIVIEYEKFLRHRSPETVRLTVIPSSDTVRLQFSGEYMRRIEIKKIVPEPEQVIPGADASTFVFQAKSARPMQIAFHFQPEKIGRLDGWMGLEGQSRLTLSQFVYP